MQAARAGELWEWVWRTQALRVARATAQATELERLRLHRAQRAAELADRALEPVEPLPSGPGHALAISLYREAAYWALLARQPDTGSPSLRELFASQPDTLTRSGLPEADLANVREALAEQTFIQTADDPPARLVRDAELCRTFVRALLHGSGGVVDDWGGVAGLLAQRWLRMAAALTLAVALALAAGSGIRRVWMGPDLAQGAPWTLSTKWTDCHPEQRECGGVRTQIFFHTTFENNPWFQLDLGRVRQVGRVRIENRDDCCQERALPLIVEVRDETGAFREVARRTELFQNWEVAFTPAQARYVRLRVPQATMLHLSRVELRQR